MATAIFISHLPAHSQPSLSLNRHRPPLRRIPSQLLSSPRKLPVITSHSPHANHDKLPSAHAEETPETLLDRRELLAASVAAGLSSLSSSPAALASPVVPPDLNNCGLASVSSATDSSIPTISVRCCLPIPTRPAKKFSFPVNPPKRIRQPAHLVDANYIAKYNKAYELMKALPDSDPRSFVAQANVHCAFCNGAYTQVGSSNLLQIHFSWIFFPWHRWYLYFHEKILGSLIGDPNFSLVFWNWDNQTSAGGNMIPAMFMQQTSSLYDSKRDQNHLPPVINTLNIQSLTDNPETDIASILEENLNVMNQSVVAATTPTLFLGGQYSAGDATPSVGGSVENGPHTAIHAWVGDPRETYGEDMGNFYSAGRDSLFYAHHANVDRLWTVWNTLGGRRADSTESDFLNAEFVFYDEKQDLIKVTAKDALSSSKLGVFYPKLESDKLWINFEAASSTAGTSPNIANLTELGAAAQNASEIQIGKKLTTIVTRPLAPPQDLLDKKKLKTEEAEEVLVLEDVKVPKDKPIHLATFINFPDADDKTPLNIAEYVGSFYNLPHLRGEMDMDTRRVDVRFGIGKNLKKIGITGVSKLAVTVVSKLAGKAGSEAVSVSLKGVRIEYD